MTISLFFIKINLDSIFIQKDKLHIGLHFLNQFHYNRKFKQYLIVACKYQNSTLNYCSKNVIWREKWDLIKNNYIFKYGIEAIKIQLPITNLYWQQEITKLFTFKYRKN